jgi:diadenosine tetraphosphate (Ap4A) HIT family hydrolase
VSAQIDLPGGWFLKPHAAPCPVAGWCVLELVRPCPTLDALTPDESRDMGAHIRRVSAAIRAVTGCERVYLLAFAEAHRQVHVHLVPRHETDDSSKAWALADLYRAVAAGSRPPASERVSEETFKCIVQKVLVSACF